ncbi:MAG: tRNA lysidine(34) synthetase TilS [Gammaproteobacteria bacterium]|jgi:tRNA(Ile)-lysidine synthase|nr:tRNA lysidine(34) synthetase TilS [Gammaproteobacteria bacterium]
MLEIVDRLSVWLQLQTATNIVVAYSGGRDSHVLLHALWKLKPQFGFQLRAIHVNHGLQKDADNWVLHCQQTCQSYQVPLQIVSLQLIIPPGESLENVARIKRYAAFADLLQEKDVLLTAHTQSDQAETFLLQMIRGSGLQGLGAIVPSKRLGKAKLVRPLLDVSRDAIVLYAKTEQLTWVEDKSNNDLRFRRNYLRKMVLPPLKTLSESVETCIARTAQHCQHAQALLDEYLIQDLQLCLGDETNILNVNAFLTLTTLKQQYVFRHWLKLNGAMSPSLRKCQDILNQIKHARIDSEPCIAFGHWEIRRYMGKLFLLTRKEQKAHTLQTLEWPLSQLLQLPDGSSWQAKIVKGQGISVEKIPKATLQIAFRKGGERCRIQGRKHSRELKKILQDFKIPTWERAGLPLFYQESELVGVGALFICEPFAVRDPEAEGWLIENVT